MYLYIGRDFWSLGRLPIHKESKDHFLEVSHCIHLCSPQLEMLYKLVNTNADGFLNRFFESRSVITMAQPVPYSLDRLTHRICSM